MLSVNYLERYFTVVVILIFSGCKGNDELPATLNCAECNQPSNFVDSISDQRFELHQFAAGEFLLLKTGENNRWFQFCDSVDLPDGFENGKILNLTGVLFLTCGDSLMDGSVRIDDYEILKHCPETYDTIQGDFSLVGESWKLIHLVEGGDTTLYPCEATPPDLTIQEHERGVYLNVGLGYNGMIIEPFHRDSLIKVKTDFIHLPKFEMEVTMSLPPNQAVSNFESKYQSFFECDTFPCKLQYEIVDNLLTVRNVQSGMLAFFYREE